MALPLTNPETGPIPPRPFEELIELIPQEVAARPTIAQVAGEITIISCLDDPASSQQLERLTCREYEVVLLAAQGHQNNAIAEEIGVRPGTVRFHMSNAEAKLEGRNSRQQAGRLIPIEHDRLDSLPTTNLLTHAERSVFYLHGEGLSTEEIRQELDVVQQTVKFHSKNIGQKLGLGRNGLNLGVELKRFAGAARNRDAQLVTYIEDVRREVRGILGDKSHEDIVAETPGGLAIHIAITLVQSGALRAVIPSPDDFAQRAALTATYHEVDKLKAAIESS